MFERLLHWHQVQYAPKQVHVVFRPLTHLSFPELKYFSKSEITFQNLRKMRLGRFGGAAGDGDFGFFFCIVALSRARRADVQGNTSWLSISNKTIIE